MDTVLLVQNLPLKHPHMHIVLCFSWWVGSVTLEVLGWRIAFGELGRGVPVDM
jgi:hypothetical protein